MPELNTLGLDDDLDGVSLLVAIEHAFGVTVSDEEAASIVTMGDLHRIVAAKLDGAGGNVCRTSMAFHRVRRAFQTVTGRADIRPDTCLSGLVGRSPRAFFADAQRHCELRLPRLSRTIMGHAGLLLILVLLPVVLLLGLAQVNGWLILGIAGGTMVVGAALVRLDPRAFGHQMLTVGDIARRMATENFGALVRSGARSDSDGIWAALVELAALEAHSLTAEQIRPDTILLQSQFDKARARA